MHEGTIYTGVDTDLRLAVREVDLDNPTTTLPLDTTGWVIEAYVKALPDDAAPLLTLSSASGEITAVDAASGKWDLRFGAAATSALTPGKRHLFVRGTEPGGEIRLIHEGRIVVRSGPVAP